MEAASFSDTAPTLGPAPAPESAPAPRPRTPTTQDQADDYDFLYDISPQRRDQEKRVRLLHSGGSESILGHPNIPQSLNGDVDTSPITIEGLGVALVTALGFYEQEYALFRMF